MLAHEHAEGVLSGPIANESELTAGVRIEPGRTYGFLTDTTLCIGCKACEVACKEWNALPADALGLTGQSYDNTGALSAATWRHVSFVEQISAADGRRVNRMQPFQSNWLMMSDVCKHCENAACLQACPTGALFRTEFGSVVVQQDICNGCGYCVPACPFGVIATSQVDGAAHKCTLCYDRAKGGFEPACAKSCPTESIQFGELGELQQRAGRRVTALHEQGVTSAYLYGVQRRDGQDGAGDAPGTSGGIGDLHAFFLLTEQPEVYNLPQAPSLPSRRLRPGFFSGLAAVAAVAAAAAAIFLGGANRDGREAGHGR